MIHVISVFFSFQQQHGGTRKQRILKDKRPIDQLNEMPEPRRPSARDRGDKRRAPPSRKTGRDQREPECHTALNEMHDVVGSFLEFWLPFPSPIHSLYSFLCSAHQPGAASAPNLHSERKGGGLDLVWFFVRSNIFPVFRG